jgi:beta-lactamase regulating signal transducer with metallopeptidase domain
MNVLEAVARISTERMLNCFIAGFAIALLTWALLRIVGRRNSGTRFAAWFSALIAIAALPLVGSSGVNATGAPPQITVPGSWAVYLFAAWAVVALAGLARVAYGFWQVRRLRQSSTELGSVDPRLKSSIEEFFAGKTPQPRISVSDAVRVPVAIGFFRPMIVLPTWTIEELSPAELRTILLHELAHLRRGDHWTNLAQKILGALFFFHPAVWWIEKQISLEREMACDDAVLEQVSNPRAYAECLVTVAEKSLVRRGLTLVQAAVSRARQTTLRIASILDGHRPDATRIWKPALVLVSGVSLVCVSVVEHAPRLIGFSDGVAAPPAVAVDSSIDRVGGVGRGIVMPAALHWNSNTASPAIPGARTKQVRQNNPHPAPAMPTMMRTKATMTKPQSTMLIRASMRKRVEPQHSMLILASEQQQQPVTPPETVFVVMHSVQSDGTGSLVWSLCVWRVTVAPENKVQKGSAQNAI